MFEPTFSDPPCSLNKKETTEFVRSSFPMATLARSSSSSSNGHGRHHEASTTSSTSSSSATSAQRRTGESQQQQAVAVPATPGRPLQFFTSPAHHHHHHQLVAPRRSVPSKWEDAEKWLRQSSDSDHGNGNGKAAFSRQWSSGLGHRGGAGGEDEKRAAMTLRRSVDALRDSHSLALYTPPAEVLLKGVIFISSRICFSEFYKKVWYFNSTLSLQDADFCMLQTSSPTTRSRPRRASCSGARTASRCRRRARR